MDIQILPSNIANMIAAGEVVQRPSSVVKELLENAVDAGATNIAVNILDAGRTLIQVVDNGCGMTPDQAVLCFERHATSKLHTAQDLHNILTFGFRGEALASIASVAEVTLKTRTDEEQVGCEVVFADSKHLSTTEISCAVGANFIVRNLFYNIPARRKFLKSDNVEFKHIVEEFIRVALTRPSISFALNHNGKDIYVARYTNSLKFRIQDLFTRSLVSELVEIKTDTSLLSLSGFIGRPDMARKTLGNQFFFVNGRFFKSPYLHKAVIKAYDKLVPEGATPSYFLQLEIDPNNIDVNIHPTKTEIKFEDESIVFQIIFAAVKEVLAKHSFGEIIDFEADKHAQDMPIFGSNYQNYRPEVLEPSASVDANYNPFNTGVVQSPFDQDIQKHTFVDPFSNETLPAPAEEDIVPYNNNDFTHSYPTYNAVDQRQDYGKLFEDKTLPTTSTIILRGKYIVTPVQSGLLTVDIYRALERVFYERFLRIVAKNGHATHISLFPISIQIGVENRLIIQEYLGLLNSLGFDFQIDGTDSITIIGVPDGFSCDPNMVEQMVYDLLTVLAEDHSALPGMIESAMALKFAKLGAKQASALSSPIQAQKLIDTLFACENCEYTINGLKIMSIISFDEIEKKF